MIERRQAVRGRTLLAGKIVFNNKRSVIDCVIRNLSDDGACLAVNAGATVPTRFELGIDGDRNSAPCHITWRTETRIGIRFDKAESHNNEDTQGTAESEGTDDKNLLRSDILAIKASLDEAPIGVVLLDSETKAVFINRAFRKMWRLSDEMAKRNPPFVALMYHGRDTHAYAVPEDRLDAYIAERVARIKAGELGVQDVRLANGEVIRLHCTPLPSGGRVLFYTYVTDIVRHSDDLEMLRSALDQTEQGIILLDEFLNVQYLNKSVRRLWKISDEQADRKPSYVELVTDSRTTGTYRVAPEHLSEYIAERVAIVRAGDPTPVDIQHANGQVIRAQCAVLPRGGRMITYTDVTDLVAKAKQFEDLASLDPMTGVGNRRLFEERATAEWERFQRYQRPLAIALIDIDGFKAVNDQHGHEIGDQTIMRVAAICKENKRSTDILARVGGDEFAILLPETTIDRAVIVANRISQTIQKEFRVEGRVPVTISIGIAAAKLSMSGVGALVALADKALYQAKAAGRNCVRTIGLPMEVVQRAAE